jgi:deazaflavin-dependent oxidoreductase (nitroreductase family)
MAIQWIKQVAIPWFTGLGITSRTVTLEVRGRKTGRTVRVSLSRTGYGGDSYFVSLGGEADWVKNVRAAGGEAVIVSRRKTPVRLEEIPPGERAPVLWAYVQNRAFTHSGAQASRHFFGLGPRPTLEEMEQIAGRFVVFKIQAGSPRLQGTSTGIGSKTD